MDECCLSGNLFYLNDASSCYLKLSKAPSRVQVPPTPARMQDVIQLSLHCVIPGLQSKFPSIHSKLDLSVRASHSLALPEVVSMCCDFVVCMSPVRLHQQ